jgi:hypothetical protein
MSTLTELTEQILAFRDARNWKQFHSPRNLAAAIAIEKRGASRVDALEDGRTGARSRVIFQDQSTT